MKIVTRISDLDHPIGISTGFVPTMGGFHEGHLQLMRTARTETERVVVSLFVNPTQFGQGEDYQRYPRNLEKDAGLAEKQGVDILFAPEVDEIYPHTYGTTIHVPVVTSQWEGASRPGHFEGVATVVCKLFNIVRPDLAYFGQKDLQQCRVITRMVEDLNMPIRLSIQSTVRDIDGLALSSRNVYLTEEERHLAPMVFQGLSDCKQALLSSELTVAKVEGILRQAKDKLEDAGFQVDYFELINLDTMHDVRVLAQGSALIVAARLGRTRLIDNVLLTTTV